MPLTIVARQFDAADRTFARRYGVHLIEADLSDAKTYGTLKLHRCRRVIVACGNDTMNGEVASAAAAEIESAYRQGFSGAFDQRLPRGTTLLRGWRTPINLRDAHTLQGEAIVHVHIASLSSLDALTRTRDLGFVRGGGFEAFSIKEVSARRLLIDAFPTELARRYDQDSVHIVIVGFGDLGEAILREAIMDGCAPGLKPPQITVIDPNAPEIARRIRLHYASLFDGSVPSADRISVRFLSGRAELLDFERTNELRPAEDRDRLPSGQENVCLEDLQSPTLWVFACKDDDTNLRAAAFLDDAMQRGFRHLRPVYARYWQARLRDTVSEPDMFLARRNPLQSVRIFGAVEETVRHLRCLEQGPLDDLPIALHAAYTELLSKEPEARLGTDVPVRGSQGTSDPDKLWNPHDVSQKFRAGWTELPEEFRLANRRLSDHAAVTLHNLGFDWRGRHEGILPETSAKLWMQVDPGDPSLFSKDRVRSDDEELLFRSAESEHRRWMIERALRGWTPVSQNEPARENTRRVHPNMVPFDKLAPSTIGISDGSSKETSPRMVPERDTRLNDAGLIFALFRYLYPRHQESGMSSAHQRPKAVRLTKAKAVLASDGGLISPADDVTELHLFMTDILSLTESPNRNGKPRNDLGALNLASVKRLIEGAANWVGSSPSALRLVLHLSHALPAGVPEPLERPGIASRIGSRRFLRMLTEAVNRASPHAEVILQADFAPLPRAPMWGRMEADKDV